MKPTASDFLFWEAYQARHVPSWARAIDARRSRHAKRYDGAQPIAANLHAAINARADIGPWHHKGRASPRPNRNARDTNSAVVMVAGWADQLQRQGYTYAGGSAKNPRTLADSLRASLRDYGTDRKRNPRGPTFARILRRLEKR